jgi:hypothetical protein
MQQVVFEQVLPRLLHLVLLQAEALLRQRSKTYLH